MFNVVTLLNKNTNDSWKIPLKKNVITENTSISCKMKQLSLELKMTNRDDKCTETTMTIQS